MGFHCLPRSGKKPENCDHQLDFRTRLLLNFNENPNHRVYNRLFPLDMS